MCTPGVTRWSLPRECSWQVGCYSHPCIPVWLTQVPAHPDERLLRSACTLQPRHITNLPQSTQVGLVENCMQRLEQAAHYLMDQCAHSGARDVARSGGPEGGGSAGGWELVFHKGQSQVAKPQAAAICAGAQPRPQMSRQLLPWLAWPQCTVFSEVQSAGLLQQVPSQDVQRRVMYRCCAFSMSRRVRGGAGLAQCGPLAACPRGGGAPGGQAGGLHLCRFASSQRQSSKPVQHSPGCEQISRRWRTLSTLGDLGLQW